MMVELSGARWSGEAELLIKHDSYGATLDFLAFALLNTAYEPFALKLVSV
jgi:hypothetical protein